MKLSIFQFLIQILNKDLKKMIFKDFIVIE